jgi:hypothetical protein
MSAVSIQIPEEAEPGDTISFTVNGSAFELQIPLGTRPGDVLQLQLAAAEDQGDITDSSSETLQLPDGRKLTLHSQLPSGEGDHDGTHRLVWPAARFLIEHGFSTVTGDSPPNKILELGAGLGVVGLAFAATSLQPVVVTLTDVDAAMPLLIHNVQENSALLPQHVEIQTKPLLWSTPEDSGTSNMEHYDLILGSDLLYNVQSIEALVATVLRHLKLAGTIVLSVRWRKPDLERSFFQQTQGSIKWTLSADSHCPLGWKEFGDPCSQASNLYLTQTMVSCGGTPTSLADITQEEAESIMTSHEYEAWERAFTQVYTGIRGPQTQ